MGMTFEKHTEQLKKLKPFHNGSYGASINFAIDTMRKYQKIEQIYQKWNEVNDFSYNQAMREIGEVVMAIKALEQESTSFQWCTDCKEYDQEKHCCHRWSKVIRNTVEEIKQEQEPILDKIRFEIEQLPTTTCTETRRTHIDADDFKENVLAILDKYKAEIEPQKSEDKK